MDEIDALLAEAERVVRIDGACETCGHPKENHLWGLAACCAQVALDYETMANLVENAPEGMIPIAALCPCHRYVG